MKVKFLQTIILTCVCMGLFAQNDHDTSKIKTLFNLSKYEKGFYLGTNLNFSNFKTSNILFSEINGGLVLNHDLYLGLNVNGIINMPVIQNIDENDNDYSDALLVGGYGGIIIEKIIFSKKIIHFTLPVQIGGGGLFYMTERRYSQIDNDGDMVMRRKLIDKYGFFYIEPGISVEINVLQFMRLNVGVKYRITTKLDLQGTNYHEFNKLSTTIGFKFGKF